MSLLLCWVLVTQVYILSEMGYCGRMAPRTTFAQSDDLAAQSARLVASPHMQHPPRLSRDAQRRTPDVRVRLG